MADQLTALGVAGMTITKSATGTVSAPFVNAEVTEYLVLEDHFPNGRPPLEQAVSTSPIGHRGEVGENEGRHLSEPLHTALAVFGCLLDYQTISAEMRDTDLVTLVERIAGESLPWWRIPASSAHGVYSSGAP